MPQPQPENPVVPEKDAVLIVSQNNAKRLIKIKEINKEAAELLGYHPTELEGVSLQDVLGKRAVESIDDFLEFEDDAPDLDTVLSRVPEFRMKSKKGEELLLAMRIYRDPARDSSHWFRIILKDERRQIQDHSLQQMIAENMAGVQALDEATGLPDHYSAGKYVELTQKYVNTHDLNATFAIVRIDRHNKNLGQYGEQACVELLRHVASCCKTKFRADDVVCRLSDHAIGLLLLDISPESSRVVLNRLRWFIASHRINFGGKPNFSVTASVIFSPLRKDETRNVVAECEKTAGQLDEDTRNELIELKA